MRELNVNEIEEVNGGNPVIAAIVAIQVGKLLVKAAKSKKVQAVVASAIGGVVGWFSE